MRAAWWCWTALTLSCRLTTGGGRGSWCRMPWPGPDIPMMLQVGWSPLGPSLSADLTVKSGLVQEISSTMNNVGLTPR